MAIPYLSIIVRTQIFLQANDLPVIKNDFFKEKMVTLFVQGLIIVGVIRCKSTSRFPPFSNFITCQTYEIVKITCAKVPAQTGIRYAWACTDTNPTAQVSDTRNDDSSNGAKYPITIKPSSVSVKLRKYTE